MKQALPPATLNTKYTWANSLRAVATIGVMLLHVAAPVNSDYSKISLLDWWSGNIYGAGVRWCVPIFVMLSGSFALNKYNGNLKDFFSKTFKRIVLPFIFWSLFYLLFYHATFLFNTTSSFHEKASFVFTELIGGSAVHLWFVCMIVSMYLLFPFISKWTTYCSEKEIILFIGIWFIYLTIIPFFEDVDTHFDFSYFTGFIGYLILGNYLFKKEISINNKWIALACLASFAYTVVGTYYVTKRDHELNEFFLAGLTPNIVILSASVYLLFKNTQLKLNAFWHKTINLICEHSYGIFLIHILVLTLLNQYGVQYNLFSPILSVPVITVLCFLLSFVLVYVLKKIPLLKKLIG